MTLMVLKVVTVDRSTAEYTSIVSMRWHDVQHFLQMMTRASPERAINSLAGQQTFCRLAV